MCVAVLKPAGAECPAMSVLKECWDANHDGAGVAVSEKRSVFIRKGFMKFTEFERWFERENIARRVSQAIVFHFRIGTHGEKDAGNTHPFPVSQDPDVLRRLCGRYREAVAHNGVFHNTITLKGVSDTGQFMADCAKEGGDPVKFWDTHKSVTGWSRLVVLKPNNRYELRGDWHSVEGSGCFFSNVSWRNRNVYTPRTDSRAFGTGGWFDVDPDSWYWDEELGRFTIGPSAKDTKKPSPSVSAAPAPALAKYLGADVKAKPASGIMTPEEVRAAGGEPAAKIAVPVAKTRVRIVRKNPATGRSEITYVNDGERIDVPCGADA